MKFILIATLFISNVFTMNYEVVVAVEHRPEDEKRAMETLMKKCGKDTDCIIRKTAVCKNHIRMEQI